MFFISVPRYNGCTYTSHTIIMCTIRIVQVVGSIYKLLVSSLRSWYRLQKKTQVLWRDAVSLLQELGMVWNRSSSYIFFFFWGGGKVSNRFREWDWERFLQLVAVCSKPWLFPLVKDVKVNNYPILKKTGQFHSGFLGSPFLRVPRSHCSTSNRSDIWSIILQVYWFTADIFFSFLVTKQLTFDKDRSQKNPIRNIENRSRKDDGFDSPKKFGGRLYWTWQFFVTFLGWLSDPFQRLSDLQLGDEKVTLNHLVNRIFLAGDLLVVEFFDCSAR